MSKIDKKSLFGTMYSIINYVDATNEIIEYAVCNKSYGVSALAVHGLVESYRNNELKDLVNSIHLVVPDGQPIRWVLNSFYNTKLQDRVYGPTLTLKVLEKANEKNLKVFLFGSTDKTITLFKAFIIEKFPQIQLVGTHVDRFREATIDEDLEDIQKINNSHANIILVGRGCPRQEVWVANHIGKVNAVMMAVGAAFDFHAGVINQAPVWMQDNGLEWLYRLIQEPRRLFKRYLNTNSFFIYLFLKYKILNLKHK
jgi:exopolysaccharide biosynthesis WecB/TagA/CpsF family protein